VGANGPAETHTKVVYAVEARLRRQGKGDGTAAQCGRRVRASRVALLRVLAVGLLSLGAVVSTTFAASSAAGAPCGFLRPHSSPRVYRHVITIVMENHAFAEIAGRSPYLNRLASACGLGDNYSAITHPSVPNYIAVTSGDTAGITDDCTDCSVSTSSIFGQVGPRGWRAYGESMPATGFTGSQAGTYAKKHNPAAYYSKLAGAYARNAVPLGTPTAGALISDLRANRLPRYSFITPDLCNDEHDCAIRVGDAWLARWVPKILASRAYRAGGTALFITYDEGSDSDNRVYTVVVSPTTRKGTVSHAAFTHYSLLKTQESLLGLRCLGHACAVGTASMRNAFGL
jgi:phosphatidylinositol-3-phosphatase